MFKGSTEEVNISSDPDGAKVYINGQMMGKTPLQLNLVSKDTYTLEFKKDGYESKIVIVNNSIGAGGLF